MKIDSHQHFWRLSNGYYSWLMDEDSPASLEPIRKHFEPKDLYPQLQKSKIDKTIVVQAADCIEETDYLLKVAAEYDWIAGVVGWVDMLSPCAIEALDRLSQNKKFKGIRPMLQGLDKDDWILQKALDPCFDALNKMGLTFDALVDERHLPHLLKRLTRTPEMNCIINHAAKPNILSGDIANWRNSIRDIAENTNAKCKLSGLLTEAPEGCSIDDLRPTVDYLIDIFSPSRLMFGSDWPVLTLNGKYSKCVDIVEEFTKEFNSTEYNDFWANNATQAYSI